nr:receptor-like kinase TMK3 [Aegilops tauschii subsp. strangulata]
MKVLFFFLLLLAAGHRCAAVTSSEDAAYMHLLAAATGADGTLGCKAGADPCDGGWAGVRCELGRVTGISVRAKGLAGSVPDAANGSLSVLEDLDFGNNNITGRFPLLLLPRLTYLWLDGNVFTSMPETFFSGMPLLQVLNEPHQQPTSNAGIVGSLDGIFTNTTAGFPFPSLDAVCFAGNRMVGTPPDMRGGVITKLDLSSNLFSGPISFITGVASSIQHLKLSHNEFSGELPDFTDFAWLGLLSLDHNKITGVVPASLPQLSRITAVNLAGNLLQGPLPEFGKYVVTDLAEAAAGGSFCRLDRGPCDPEVAALLSIAGALGFPLIVARSWLRNDACAGWIGVHCDGQRRVTDINLSRLGLNGSLSSAQL